MPSVPPVGFDLTKTDPDVTDALTLLDRPRQNPRCVELYKVWEIIKNDDPTEAVRKAAGVSSNQITRFTSAANHQRASGADARHARMNTEPPLNSMTLTEADEMICKLVREWIRQRVNAQAASTGVVSTHPSIRGVSAMAAEAKREPGPLKRWFLKLRENWRRSSAMKRRLSAAQRSDADRMNRYR